MAAMATLQSATAVTSLRKTSEGAAVSSSSNIISNGLASSSPMQVHLIRVNQLVYLFFTRNYLSRTHVVFYGNIKLRWHARYKRIVDGYTNLVTVLSHLGPLCVAVAQHFLRSRVARG